MSERLVLKKIPASEVVAGVTTIFDVCKAGPKFGPMLYEVYVEDAEASVSDPLDEAIVKAAIAIHEFRKTAYYPVELSPLTEGLCGAVQAKLDAEKPKTAEEVAARAFDLSLPVAAAPIAIVQALRDEGLLKE